MDSARAGYLGRKYLPGFAFRFLRRLGIVAWTPFQLSITKGHARSAWIQRAVDRHGRPIPWYTYPCIDFLSNKSLAGLRVLEFGAGQSSLWWVERCGALTSLEGNSAWRDYVASRIERRAEILLVSQRETLPARILEQKYDIIVIDGLRRNDAARVAVKLLAPNGAIVFDDSQGLWSDDGVRYEVVELMRAQGFSRVDFFGFSPGGIGESCTSIYFKDRCLLFDSPEPPRVGNATGTARPAHS
jgi:hypothetical protein